jgi:hypothetical protein
MNKDTRQYVKAALQQFGPVEHETLDMYEDAWSSYSDTEILEALRSWNRDKEKGGRRFTAAAIIERMDLERRSRQNAKRIEHKKATRYDCLGRGCFSIRCLSCHPPIPMPEWFKEKHLPHIAKKNQGNALTETPQNASVLAPVFVQALEKLEEQSREPVDNAVIDKLQAILDDESYDQCQGIG